MVNLHADDYGITPSQAKEILELRANDGHSGLTSVSIFANSPLMQEAAKLIAPLVDSGEMDVALHMNLVEGYALADPEQIPLLVDERGAFKRDFVSLMLCGAGPSGRELERQVRTEAAAQLQAFLRAFPDMKDGLRVDSHQHTHMVPAVFDGLMGAVSDSGATLRQVRVPVEDIAPYKKAGKADQISFANKLKNALLSHFAKRNARLLPDDVKSPAFCGVYLSGNMQAVDSLLLDELESHYGSDIEVLFHPVSVPASECLDPANEPFAQACASASRDAESATIRSLS